MTNVVSESLEGLSKFVQKTMAQLAGNTDKVIALKNEKIGKSAFKAQHSLLSSQLEKDLNKLEQAQEAFDNSFNPTSLIEDDERYLANIQSKKKALDQAQKVVEATKKDLEFYATSLKTEFEYEVN